MKGNYENLKEEFWNGISELKKAQDRLTESQDRLIESQEATDKQMKETDRKIQDTAEQMKETDKLVSELSKSIDKTNGNFDNKWGLFLENLVKGDLVKLLKKRGIEVDIIQPRLVLKGKKKGISEGEIDLVAINGEELVAVEVKTDLRIEYVDRFLEQLKKFKKCVPQYKDRKIYGGMAFLSCDNQDALDALKENGLFIIKAVGGKADVSIIDNPKDFRPKEY